MSSTSAVITKETKPKTSRQLKAEQTKERLLETGKSLVAQRKLDDISISEIAELSEVSTGTFYVHFESKEAYFAEVFHRFSSRLFEVNEANEHEPALGQLSQFIEFFLDQLCKMDVGFLQQWFAHFGDSSFYEPYGYSSNPGERHYLHVRQLLTMAVANGELLEETPIRDLTNVITMLLSGLGAQAAMSSRAFNLEKRADFVYKYIIDTCLEPYYPKQRPA